MVYGILLGCLDNGLHTVLVSSLFNILGYVGSLVVLLCSPLVTRSYSSQANG